MPNLSGGENRRFSMGARDNTQLLREPMPKLRAGTQSRRGSGESARQVLSGPNRRTRRRCSIMWLTMRFSSSACSMSVKTS